LPTDSGDPIQAEPNDRVAHPGHAGSRRPPAAEQVFVALADPTRRQMLERLADGPATITALHAALSGPPITRQAASKHLRVLADAGLVTDRKEGRERRYTLAPAALASATGWLTGIEDRWNRRFEALRRLVEET
jgi:DNA-binding transcriptional ArsR family regulator